MGSVTLKSVSTIGTTSNTYGIVSGIPAGHVAERSSDPKGSIVQKEYDKAGRLLKVTADGRTITYEYNLDGSRKKVIHPDNSTSEYEYDTAGLLNVMRNKRSNGTVMDSYTYSYDAARNQTAKVEVINVSLQIVGV